MKSKLTEEERKKRNMAQNRVRVQRFRDVHHGEYKTFKAELKAELFDEIDAKLNEDGITKKQFIESAVKDYLKSEE